MPMKMLVQAAIERGDEEGLKGRSLQILRDEIARLEQSIQTILDFARPPVVEKAPTDLRGIVNATIDLVVPRAKQQQVELRTTLPGKPLLVMCDAAQIRQLLLNLALNALDVLPEGGAIEFTIKKIVEPAVAAAAVREKVAASDLVTLHDALRILAEKPRDPEASWIQVGVADSGPGIPPELLGTIFDPFVTTKDTGTGLGLSICQRIAAAHGGSLTVRNRPAGGAEFLLRLPYSE